MRFFVRLFFISLFLCLYNDPGMGYCDIHAPDAASGRAASANPPAEPSASDFYNTLTRAEQDWLKAHPVIRLGFAVDRPPYEFLDAQGHKTGIVADYFDLLENRLHVTFKRQCKPDGSPLLWPEIEDAGRRKTIDVIASLMRTKERERYLGFTQPYTEFPWAFVARQDAGKSRDISDYYGQKAAVVAGYPIAKQLPFLYPKLNLVMVDTPMAGLQAVSNGKAAVFVNNAADAVYLIKKTGLSQLKIAGILPDIDSKLRMGVRNDWPILVGILDKAIASVSPREAAAIQNNWISLDFDNGINWKQVIFVTVPAVLVILVIIVVISIANHRLQKEVKVRKKTEDALRQSEEDLRFALEISEAYYFQFDRRTDTITYSSEKIFTKHGYTDEDIPRTNEAFSCFVHPDDEAVKNKKYKEYIKNDLPALQFYFRFRKFGGDGWFWINTTSRCVEWDEHGNPVRFVGLHQDITERQNLYEKIKESQEMLRIISEHTYDWQTWWDLDDKLVWVNQAVERVTGYSVEQCMSMPDYPRSLIDERDWDLFREKTQKALNGQGRQECVLRVHKKDGTRIFVSTAYEPVLDKNGQIMGLAGAAKDITEQKEAERGLRLMLRVFEDGADPIIITDLSGNILELNDAAVKAYGYAREDLLDKKIGVLVSKASQAREKALFQRCINGEILKNIEGDRIRKDGSLVPHLFTFSLLKNDMGNPLGIASMAKDITELKQAENELKDYRDHLEDLVRERTCDLEAAKFMAEDATKAKSDFLANMSHEIRTPLNAIIGFAHLALQTRLDALQSDYLHKIQNGSKVLLGVINDILDFSKIEAGKLNMESIEFSLEDVLETVTNLVGIRAQEKGLEVVYNIEPSIPKMLIGDPGRLSQILLNLTNNAVKFTKTGEIVLGCALSGNQANEAQLEFYVQDSGIGLTTEQQHRLFQAFSQADSSTTRKYGGTGLGLFISKSLVEMMNGRIWLESEYGKGSTFYFTVRLKRVNSDTVISRLSRAEIGHKKVLVVDDNYISRTVLAKMLEAMSLKVIQAESAEAGLAELDMAASTRTPFDLVFMDWQMPGMDGLKASEKIKNSMRENIPSIIMVSAYAREEVMQQAQRIGLDGYLIKPVSPSLLADSIVSALGGKAFTRALNRDKHEKFPDITDIQGARLLVAEDNEVNRQVARGILEKNGFIVDTADDGRIAVQALENNRYDAVLMDINMPEMDGYAACLQIRKNSQFKDLPVIAMTANAMAGDREKALAAGMNDHVAKPIDVKALLNVLQRWIRPAKEEKEETGPTPGSGASAANKKTPHHFSCRSFGPLPGINIEDGLGRLAGDCDMYRDLLRKFAKNQANTALRIVQAIQTDDMETAQRLAHTIKGVSGNIGATSLFNLATLLDAALKQGSRRDALAHLPDFTACLDEVVQGINAMEQDAAIAEPTPGGQRVDPETLRPLLMTLHDLLEDDDTESGSVVRQLREKVDENISGALLDQLSQKISEYDFDTAKEILGTLGRNLGIEL